jgi:LmbE family N-acetylglucosaminyl deacetylase
MAATVLAIGAHFDDCVFGIPGILLQAVARGHRVVVLSVIGDYANWTPTRGRERDFLSATTALSSEHGVEMRFLPYASQSFDVGLETKRAVAEVVADVRPDIGFMLWPHDRHHDHEVVSTLSKIALRHGDRVLGGRPCPPPKAIYLYDNGPRHTLGFEPDVFVDITPEWPRARAWLARLMALAYGPAYDPAGALSPERAKEVLAAYRGLACGVRYAEAVRSGGTRVSDLFSASC